MALHNIPKEVLFEQTAKYAAIGAGLGALLSAGVSIASYKQLVRDELKRLKINPRLKANKERIDAVKKHTIKQLLKYTAAFATTGATTGAIIGHGEKESREADRTGKYSKEFIGDHLTAALDKLEAAKRSGNKSAILSAKWDIRNIMGTAKRMESEVPDIGKHILNIAQRRYGKV